jgi:hypothetical protein
MGAELRVGKRAKMSLRRRELPIRPHRAAASSLPPSGNGKLAADVLGFFTPDK